MTVREAVIAHNMNPKHTYILEPDSEVVHAYDEERKFDNSIVEYCFQTPEGAWGIEIIDLK